MDYRCGDFFKLSTDILHDAAAFRRGLDFITCDCENHCYVDKKTRSSANSCPQCFLFTWRFDYELFPDHSPVKHEEVISICMGGYFLIYGGNAILDFIVKFCQAAVEINWIIKFV